MSEFGETYDMGKRHGYDDAISDLTRIMLAEAGPERAVIRRVADELREIAKAKREAAKV